MNRFERGLLARFGEIDLAAATPGVIVDVHVRGRRVGLVEAGKTYDFYDLASLTKILFAASRSLMLFSDSPRELRRPISSVLDWWKPSTTPFELMSHTAGLEWWLPMYKKLRGPVRPEVRWEAMKRQLRRVRPKMRDRAVYSDVDLWMMGAFLEARTGQSFLEMWDLVRDRLDLDGLFFHSGNKPVYARSRYAPTEKSPWHKRVLQGEVHDENTWALGGVALNAGLFGSVEAVSDWGLKLRRAFYSDRSGGFGDPDMVRYFVGRRIPASVGDWGLGFMKPSRGRASCGRGFSLKSFGHTGFTGTSLWFDPVQDLLVVILSNRVHPTRENQAFVKLRPVIHDWVCELLE